MEWYLGVMAMVSIWLHYHAMALYSQYEEISKTGKEVFRTHINSPLKSMFCMLFSYYGSQQGRVMALGTLGILWAMFFFYYFLIAKFFAGALLLNIINITTALFTSVSFCQALLRVSFDFPNWCRHEYNDLLSTTGGCWELVLAGTVLTHLLLQ